LRSLSFVSACLLFCIPGIAFAGTDTCSLADYQAGQRPGEPGIPTKVHLGLAIADVSAISDLDQTVTLDAVMKIGWQDSRLSQASGCRFSLDQVWHPDIQLMNSGDIVSRQPFELYVGDQGWLRGSYRVQGTIANPRSMAEFPFDEHTITLDIMSLRYAASEVEIEIEQNWTLRRADLTIPDWEIGAVSARVEALKLPQLDRTTSRYQFSIPARRIPSYYIYKIVLPLIMIVMMSWAVFWINPSNLGSQMTLAGTSMLTLVTFQFTMNDVLPRIGYFTQLDKFIFSSSALVFIALVEAVSSGFLSSRGSERIAQLLDNTSRIAFPTLYGLIVLVTLVF